MEKEKRQSNFELLRILAMIMIILFHIQIHGPQPILTGDNEFFASPIIYKRLILFEVGIPLGMIGNGLFIMISGYFMAEKANIDIGKISQKLLIQLGFATIVLMDAYAIWVTFFKDEIYYWENAKISDFNNGWWFVGYYMLVIIIAKIFLNNYVKKLSQNQFKSLLFALLAVTQFQWSGDLSEGLADGLRTLLIGLFYFYMGGYIAKYNPFNCLKIYTLFMIIILTYGVRFISAYNIISKGIDDYFKSHNEGNFIYSVQDYTNFEITVVIFIICFFELFRRIKIPYSKIVNFIGKSTLMIYFIHENYFYISFYRIDNWMETLMSSPILYCIKWIQWGTIGFGLGLLIYIIYSILGRLYPKVQKLFVNDYEN